MKTRNIFGMIIIVFVLLLAFAFPVFASGGDAAPGAVVLTPEMLAGIGGAALSLVFLYTPGMNTAYAGATPQKKALIMAACVLGVAALIAASSCFNLWVIIACTKIGILEFMQIVGITLVSNQSTYGIVKNVAPANVTAAKTERQQ